MQNIIGRNRKVKKSFFRLIFWIITALILMYFLFPPFWLLTTSFKTNVEAFTLPPKYIFTPTFDNYAKIFNNSNFGKYTYNSIVTSFLSTLICVIIGVPGGYAFGVFDFRGKSSMRYFVLATRVAPPIMCLLPLYLVFLRMNVLGTKMPLVTMYVASNLPLLLWTLPAYFGQLSPSLREAAIIDGCSEWKAFYTIMLPLTRGGIMAISILALINSWNDFLYSLILGGKGAQTLPVAITSFLTYSGTDWGPLAAAGSIVMLPMLLFSFFVQKNFVRGLTMGAVKE